MKKRFQFGDGDLGPECEGEQVGALQDMLYRFGYLRGSFAPGRFCGCTGRAVRRYQRFYGLTADGVVGPVTKRHLEQPRCGVPDMHTVLGSGGAPFVLRGCQYNHKDLTFAFLNGTPDLAGGREQEIVREAFDVWQNVADINFHEVDPGDNPDFRIAWRRGNHGDGEGFDGPGNTLAHAFFPPPCGGAHAGDMHFDEGETWIENPSGAGILLKQVAIHEIGHLLGLSHSQDQSAIMFAFYAPDRTSLADDDIRGVRALYGERSASRQLLLAATANGRLERGGDTAAFEVQAPSVLSVSIDGPAGADFDLYVRKGQPPTTSQWDYRAYTVSADEKIDFPADAGATYHVMVRSYDGSGDFSLKVEPA